VRGGMPAREEKPTPAVEQSVAVGDVHLVARPPAGRADRTRDQRRPQLDVAARIADNGRLSGSAARGMDANDVLHRHREHSEWIILPEILLRDERKTSQIIQMLEIASSNTGLRKLLAVLPHQPGTGKRLLQPHEL